MPQNVYLYNPDTPVPKNVQQVEIPEGISFIPNDAFESCYDLQSVTLPDSVTKIGDDAFAYCSALQSVAIPDGVTKIGRGAFGSTGLQSITIPDSVTEIDTYAFSHSSQLQFVTLPKNITAIRDSTFCFCPILHSIAIPEGVTEIGEAAFAYCIGLQWAVIPDSVTKIGSEAFCRCSALQSAVIPDNVTEIGDNAFDGCDKLQSLMYKGVNIAPFINIDGHRVNTFSVIKECVEHRIPLSEYTVGLGIRMAHLDKLSEWVREYPVFGTMHLFHLYPAAKLVDEKTKERLEQCFADQKKTGYHVPEILDELAITARTCKIPLERLAETFDIEYTKRLLDEKIPLVPATACRCYYDRDVCDALIQEGKISVMAEAIGLYNISGHQECDRHLMDFIRLNQDAKIEDLQHAVNYADNIPMEAGTTLAQIRRHETYIGSLIEVAKVEAQYRDTVPGFKLADCPCNLEPVSVTYDGMTARVLDLTDYKDTAIATRLGELTDCDMRLGYAGETAMMHGLLNPDAGFWVMEDRDGTILAQARIEKTDPDTLAFDFVEFAGTNPENASEKAGRVRDAIAAWATESGYKNIIMECGYKENLTESMEPAPAPKLCLTPEEVFALQKGNDAEVSFRNIDEARQYMQTEQYSPNDFVHTGMTGRCVYIKKDGRVADYLMQGHNIGLADRKSLSESKTAAEQGNDTDYR